MNWEVILLIAWLILILGSLLFLTVKDMIKYNNYLKSQKITDGNYDDKRNNEPKPIRMVIIERSNRLNGFTNNPYSARYGKNNKCCFYRPYKSFIRLIAHIKHLRLPWRHFNKKPEYRYQEKGAYDGKKHNNTALKTNATVIQSYGIKEKNCSAGNTEKSINLLVSKSYHKPYPFSFITLAEWLWGIIGRFKVKCQPRQKRTPPTGKTGQLTG